MILLLSDWLIAYYYSINMDKSRTTRSSRSKSERSLNYKRIRIARRTKSDIVKVKLIHNNVKRCQSQHINPELTLSQMDAIRKKRNSESNDKQSKKEEVHSPQNEEVPSLQNQKLRRKKSSQSFILRRKSSKNFKIIKK